MHEDDISQDDVSSHPISISEDSTELLSSDGESGSGNELSSADEELDCSIPSSDIDVENDRENDPKPTMNAALDLYKEAPPKKCGEQFIYLY